MRPVLIASRSSCWKRSNSGAIAPEKKKLSDGTGATRGCVVMIRWSHHVPLRRAPKLKIILPSSGLSALLTCASAPPAACVRVPPSGGHVSAPDIDSRRERFADGALLGRSGSRGRLLVRRQPARVRRAQRGRVLGRRR